MLSMLDINSREMLFNFYIDNVVELYKTHELFAEAESKEFFRAYITGKLSRRISDFKFAPEAQYFLEGFIPAEGDTVIDGGAYDGATARDFTMQGAKVYAFEMSNENYPLCIDRAEKYNFVVENLGLSSRECEENYIESGTGSSKKLGRGNAVAHFIDLDTYVIRKNIPRVDYIKLDIEGAELDMLHGAAKTIVRCKPKMAISAYHRPDDLWTLASYIKSLRADYELKFRHYRIDAKEYVLGDIEHEILSDFELDYFLLTQDEAVLYCR